MSASIEIFGVYPVDAPEPCHLIEIMVHDSIGPIDFGAFTQPITGKPRDNWQVPYDEIALDVEGQSRVADSFEMRHFKPEQWEGDLRFAFFFHYLDFSCPLVTPFGIVSLPAESLRPDRLGFIEYEPPC